MSVAYENRDIADIHERDFIADKKTLRERVFTTYVERMFEGKNQSVRPYTIEQFTHWLIWLARKMPDQHKMIFRIEELQPNWLSTNSLRWTYALLSRLAAGIVVGIVFGVVAVLNGGLPFMFLVWLTTGIAGGLVSGLGYMYVEKSRPGSSLSRWLKKFILSAATINIALLVGTVVARAHGTNPKLTIFDLTSSRKTLPK